MWTPYTGGPDWSPRTARRQEEDEKRCGQTQEARAQDDGQVMAIIIEALAPHPAALDAVRQALEREYERERIHGGG
jgi:hypothetical protein